MVKILLVNPKFIANVAGAVRAVSAFGAAAVLYTGDRAVAGKRRPRELRMYNVPLEHVDINTLDFCGSVVAVEVADNAEPLPSFVHPDNTLYVFGPEDSGLARREKLLCHRFVTIPTRHCLNLAAAVNVVLYDRSVKNAVLQRDYL